MTRKPSSTQNNHTPPLTEQEEIQTLRTILEAAEQARLSGQPAYSIEESRNQLNQIIGK